MTRTANLAVFADLPAEARLWVLPLDRSLPDLNVALIERQLAFFASQWTSHGRPVPSAVTVLENQIIVVAARIDESLNGGVSGCGIDSMTAAVEEAARQSGAELLDNLHVLVRLDDGKLWPCSRADIRRHADNGTVTDDSPVVDATLDRLGNARQYGVVRPASETWVRNLLPTRAHT